MMIQVMTDFLDRRTETDPDGIGYVSQERQLTFAQLRREALLTAQGLIRAGLHRKPVVIFAEKSVETIVLLFGVAYSGNFYTILDVDMPMPRVKKILDTLAPEAFLTVASLSEKAAETADGRLVLTYEDLMQEELDEELTEAVRRRILPDDLLYVLFTSGSTGTPKGVAGSHGAMVNYISCWPEVYKLSDRDRFLSQAPFYFIMASLDIFSPVAYGATTHMVPAEWFSFPAMLMNYIQEHRITALNWVPSALSIVALMDAFEVADISSVEKVLFGGEVMPMKVIRAWRQHLPEALFVNGYGSTETTDACLYYVIDRDFEDGETLPIGKPYPHVDAFLLDENDRLVTETGRNGEICARSRALSYGYYNDRELTAQVFVSNPLTPWIDEKIYRTGDLGRWNAEGNMEYGGRKDSQIKHMGHRIELGEIEANVSAYPGIDECACTYDREKSHILLYYTGQTDEKELGKALKELLPYYMQPRRRIHLEEMPHTLSGKINRKALTRS